MLARLDFWEVLDDVSELESARAHAAALGLAQHVHLQPFATMPATAQRLQSSMGMAASFCMEAAMVELVMAAVVVVVVARLAATASTARL